RRHLSKRLALCAIALAIAAGASIFSRPTESASNFTSVPIAEAPTPAVAASAVQGKSQARLTGSVLLTVTPRGFDTNEITIPADPFFLIVENRSGLSDMSLTLELEAGNRLRAVRVQREELDWAELLDLTPGTYVISEANHPDDICRLIVTPR